MIDNLQKPEIKFNLNSKIFIKKDVVSQNICDEIISYGSVNVNQGINKYPHLFKTSFHTCLLPLNHDIHKTLQPVLLEIVEFFKFDIMFAEPYELKRYTANDYFDLHIDNYSILESDIDRKITVILQLSENNYEGGDLKVLGRNTIKDRGSIIAFPSFLSHNVDKINDGVRWSLITWLWGPYWR